MMNQKIDQSRRDAPRLAMSYLEVQVAMVMLAIATTGLYSISVLQTRQSTRLNEAVFDQFDNETVAINPATSQWARKIGVLATMEETVDPEINIAPETFFSAIVDDHGSVAPNAFTDPSDSYGWQSWYTFNAFNNQAHYHFQPNSTGEGSYFEQQVTGIPSGNYEVLICYPAFPSLGDAVHFEIYDGSTLINTVQVNQKVPCNDTRLSGHTWNRIDVTPISSGTLRIRMLDGPDADYYSIGDAIAVRTRRFELMSVDRTAAGGATAVLEVP